MKPSFLARNRAGVAARWLLAVAVSLCGCTRYITSSFFQSPDEILAESQQPQHDVKLIGDYASAWGMNWMKVEAVAIVTCLNGTGSNPPDSPLRDRVLAEVETHNVRSPSSLLASPNTAMVLIRGYIPPGARKGDLFDVEVSVPGKSETTSIEGGCLMPVRLRHMELLGGDLREGEISAQASGNALVDSFFEGGDDPTNVLRGKVLGGGVVLKPRGVGLVIRGEGHPLSLTSKMAASINARFLSYDRGGVKRGVANAKDGKIIELDVPPQYRHYISRFIGVVRNLAIAETPAERLDRVEHLERELLDPETAAVTALRLEAIGEEAKRTLERGLDSDDARVRFFAAEALAYLGQTSAIEPLREAAETEPAFRWHAITALAAMDEFDAADALASLFHNSSAETRYGAFRALRSRSAYDPLVRGEMLGEKFHYHVVSTVGEPMVHVSRTRREEIVLFGHDQTIEPPGVLFVGKHIMIKGVGPDRVEVIRIMADSEQDERRTCSTRLDEIIRTIVELGGGYTDVLSALQEARSKNHMTSRLAIDALPKTGRRYYSDSSSDEAGESESVDFAGPLPELFRTGEERGTGLLRGGNDTAEKSTLEEAESPRTLFGRMFGR
jgi:hypothetical protein